MSLENAHSELLAAGIEALDSGITVFDSELRLVAVNQRFFQLIGIPPEVASPGASIEALFRYNAEHGEYGPGNIEPKFPISLKAGAQRWALRAMATRTIWRHPTSR